MFHLVLFEPKLPANTGNIIRLAANNGCKLHLIEPLGFDLQEKNLRRAGLDYHDLAEVAVYANYAELVAAMTGHRIFALTTKGRRSYAEQRYQAGDVFLFGSETAGLPDHLLDGILPEQRIKIPMMPNNRSLNLANAVAIVSYEAWRQQAFRSAESVRLPPSSR